MTRSCFVCRGLLKELRTQESDPHGFGCVFVKMVSRQCSGALLETKRNFKEERITASFRVDEVQDVVELATS